MVILLLLWRMAPVMDLQLLLLVSCLEPAVAVAQSVMAAACVVLLLLRAALLASRLVLVLMLMAGLWLQQWVCHISSCCQCGLQ